MKRLSILFIFLVSCSRESAQMTEMTAQHLIFSEYGEMQNVNLKILSLRERSPRRFDASYDISYSERGPNRTLNRVQGEAQIERQTDLWQVTRLNATEQNITFLEDTIVEVEN